MPSDAVTIAEVLRSRGYRTGMFGKWMLGTSAGHLPNDQGFEHFFGFRTGAVDYWTHFSNATRRHDLWRNNEEVHALKEYVTDLMTNEVADWVDGSQPFFAYVAYSAPHFPIQPPPGQLEQYSDLVEPRRSYAALVSSLDESVGKIMQRLDETGLSENTFVIFLSDNGGSAEQRAGGIGTSRNDPFRGYKGSLFEGGIRVPCIVRWPGQLPEGQTRTQMISATDLGPTIAALANIEMYADGKDIWDVLAKDGASPHEYLVWSFRNQIAVRKGHWKLTMNGRNADRSNAPTWLSNLADDPGEATNLSRSQPGQMEELRALLPVTDVAMTGQRAPKQSFGISKKSLAQFAVSVFVGICVGWFARRAWSRA